MEIGITVPLLSNIVEKKRNYYSISSHWNLLSAEELSLHIERCVLNNRESQKKIYNSFLNYSMAICDRYTNNREDSIEILNDGFLKVFREIHRFEPTYSDIVSSFKGWLRKIMVYTAIDHFRRNNKYRYTKELDDGIIQISSRGEDALDKISHGEIISSIQELTPAYRTVLNLYIIEGFTHEEISKQLQISIGTSKSNLSKARRQLQKILFHKNLIHCNYQQQ